MQTLLQMVITASLIKVKSIRASIARTVVTSIAQAARTLI